MACSRARPWPWPRWLGRTNKSSNQIPGLPRKVEKVRNQSAKPATSPSSVSAISTDAAGSAPNRCARIATRSKTTSSESCSYSAKSSISAQMSSKSSSVALRTGTAANLPSVMRDDVLLEILYDAAGAVRTALDGLGDWGLAGTKEGQYRSDVVADEAAATTLERAGLAVLSEETGRRPSESSLLAVLDPVDGSTNASLGLPWFATSICVLDGDGPRAAVVVNQSTGTRFDAIRGAGARCDGNPIRPSGCTSADSAIVGVSGLPPRPLGWRQFRALGAAALDLCAVASGMLDGYVDCI